MDRIDSFKKTKDYRIIFWATSIPFLNVRIDFLKQIGYKVGIVIFSKNTLVNKNKCAVFIGKDNKLRMQITNKIAKQNYAYCVIID